MTAREHAEQARRLMTRLNPTDYVKSEEASAHALTAIALALTEPDAAKERFRAMLRDEARKETP